MGNAVSRVTNLKKIISSLKQMASTNGRTELTKAYSKLVKKADQTLSVLKGK